MLRAFLAVPASFGLAMEFIRHYEHYRVTARQFARGYREYHNSRRLVQELNGTVERRILEMVP